MIIEKKTNYLLYFLIFLPPLFFLFNPAKFPADDGFFYPQIAYNIVNSKASYFNDLYLTNGYHPLWMLFCILAELINPLEKQNLVYIIWFIQVLLVLLSFSKLEIFFKNNLSGKIVSFFTLCFLFFSLGTLYLIEAPLNLFGLSLMLFFLAKNKKNDWLFGILFSVIFLTRLDNIFLLIPLTSFYFFKRNWNYKTAIKSGIIIVFLCGTYMLSNWYWFGSFVPISGRLKSSFPYIKPHLYISPICIFFLTVIMIYFILLSTSRGILFKKLKLSFALGALLQLLYNIAFQSQIGQWYYVAQILVLVLLTGDFSQILLQKRANNNRLLNYSLIISGFFVTFLTAFLKANNNFSLQSVLFTRHNIRTEKKDAVQIFAYDLRKRLPPQSRVFTYDFPGKLAFYSDLEIIPADGLVANKDYFEEISQLDFPTYLRKNKINYIILPSAFINTDPPYYMGITIDLAGKTPRYFIKNPLTGKIADSIKMKDFMIIKSYVNPIKTWQNNYDSITVYQLKQAGK